MKKACFHKKKQAFLVCWYRALFLRQPGCPDGRTCGFVSPDHSGFTFFGNYLLRALRSKNAIAGFSSYRNNSKIIWITKRWR